MKQRFKSALLSLVAAMTRRYPVLLPVDAESDAALAAVHAPYRIESSPLRIDVREPAGGRLRLAWIHDGAEAWATEMPYEGPASMLFDLRTGDVTWNGARLASVTAGHPVALRRFNWRFTFDQPARRWTTSHYVPRDGQAVDSAYYSGEDYVDYEAQSAEDRRIVLDLLRAHAAAGPVLDIGCATGAIMESITHAGYEALGLDFSQWAVDQTRKRLGRECAWRCDVEHEPLPPAITAAAPFGTILLASVFEHFASPYDVLAKLAALAGPGALLLIITTNADSLTSRIFGRDWEGHFDWTHQGVDQVSVRAMRAHLPAAGWTIERIGTHHLWDSSSDPAHATLREWFAADARFRRLLRDRDLGDFITCVARRT